MFYNKIILPVNDFEMSSSLRPCLENSFYFQFHFTCPRVEPGISTCDVCLDIGAAYAELATQPASSHSPVSPQLSVVTALWSSAQNALCGSVGVRF